MKPNSLVQHSVFLQVQHHFLPMPRGTLLRPCTQFPRSLKVSHSHLSLFHTFCSSMQKKKKKEYLGSPPWEERSGGLTEPCPFFPVPIIFLFHCGFAHWPICLSGVLLHSSSKIYSRYLYQPIRLAAILSHW